MWCRLGEVCEIIMGQSPKSENISKKGKLEFHQGKIFFTSKYIQSSESYTNEITKIAPKNSVLICVRAPVGEVNITNRELCIGRGLCSIVPLQKMSEIFVYYWTKILKEKFIQKATGSTFASISMDIIRNEIIPLPPLAEQKRIVEKIEELLALVDDLETNKTDLQSYIKQAKSKVLEMAIRGELVPQNPEDEPASVLLEHIKKEQKSSKSKGKTTAHNTHYEEELPFDIPKNWVWCRLGEVCDFERGITFPSSAKQFQYFENSIPCIRTTNVQEELELDDIWFIDKSYTKNNENKLLKINDIIMSSANSRELVGKTCLVKKIDTKFTFGGFVLVIRNKFDYNKYIFYLLRNIFFKGYFRKISTQTTNIANINIALLEEIIIPLPPLAEQHRIVEKIEHIFAVLEELEENIL